MEFITTGSVTYLKVHYNFGLVATSTTIKVEEILATVPVDFKYQNYGRNWNYFVLAESAQFFKYTTYQSDTDGAFLTLLGALNSQEAKEVLELCVTQNTANFRQTVIASKGTRMYVGLMTSSNQVQFFAVDSNNLEFIDVTGTNANWQSIRNVQVDYRPAD